MMSLDTIHALAEERAEEARLAGLEPYVYPDGGAIEPPFPFPNLGDYEPEGWVEVDRLFADSSGLGQATEPALTVGQLIGVIQERIDAHDGPVGWGIVQEGQFQVYVGEFHRTSKTRCTCEECL